MRRRSTAAGPCAYAAWLGPACRLCTRREPRFPTGLRRWRDSGIRPEYAFCVRRGVPPGGRIPRVLFKCRTPAAQPRCAAGVGERLLYALVMVVMFAVLMPFMAMSAPAAVVVPVVVVVVPVPMTVVTVITITVGIRVSRRIRIRWIRRNVVVRVGGIRVGVAVGVCRI